MASAQQLRIHESLGRVGAALGCGLKGHKRLTLDEWKRQTYGSMVGTKTGEMGESKKTVEVCHKTPSPMLPAERVSLPPLHLPDSRALLGGIASTCLDPSLYLLFPRNLTVYLEVSSK